jgi:serine protease Do
MKKSAAVFFVWVCAASAAWAASVRETPIVEVVRRCGSSVVNISTERISIVKGSPFLQRKSNLWGQDVATVYGVKTKSLGSGVVVRGDGVIATNAHVVEMASKIYVTFQNGETYLARVLGTDKSSDLALIAVDLPKPVRPIELAQDAIIGETVITVGNPYGLQNSVSQGIVSATGRTFNTQPVDRSFQDLIQTDAAIHPGASGGALLNLEGKLTGINLALFEGTSDISFAIPAYKVSRMLAEYDRVKSVVRPAREAVKT